MVDKLLSLGTASVASSLLVLACGSGGATPGESMSAPDGSAALDAASSPDAFVEASTDTGWRRVYAVDPTTPSLLLDADADTQMGRYFVVGQYQTILVGRGEEWTPIPMGSLLDAYVMPRGMFQRVWVGPGHVFVIGALGFYAGGIVEIGNGPPTIAFGDGVSHSGGPVFGGPMSAISGTTSDVWVGGSLSFARFDGTTWTMSADDFYVNAFAADSTGVLWAAGQGAILRREGNQWQHEVTTDASETALNLWIAGDGTIFSVGYAGPFDAKAGRIWIRQAGTWSTLSAGAELPAGVGKLSGVWGTSSDDVFVAGDGGALLHFDGISWQRESIDTTEPLLDVTGMGSEVIVVGAGAIWQRNR